MTKRSTEGRNATSDQGATKSRTVGLDLGDRYSHYCVLDGKGHVVEEGRIPTTREGLRRQFERKGHAAVRIALEVGTHSPWGAGHWSSLDTKCPGGHWTGA